MFKTLPNILLSLDRTKPRSYNNSHSRRPLTAVLSWGLKETSNLLLSYKCDRLHTADICQWSLQGQRLPSLAAYWMPAALCRLINSHISLFVHLGVFMCPMSVALCQIFLKILSLEWKRTLNFKVRGMLYYLHARRNSKKSKPTPGAIHRPHWSSWLNIWLCAKPHSLAPPSLRAKVISDPSIPTSYNPTLLICAFNTELPNSKRPRSGTTPAA